MKRTTVRGIVRLAVRSGGTSLKAPRPGADDASAVHGVAPSPTTAIATEALLVVGLALAGLLTRWATRSQVLYHWDSVNFALALEHYDIAAHQPHPPGYILYVLLGRLVHTVVGDANGSLVLISVLSSALLVPMAYGLGRDLFDRGTGVYAALLTLTAPLVWFYGSVALSYIAELLLTSLIAWLCFHSLLGRRGALLMASLTLAIAGGIRQNTLPLLLPLWLFCVVRAEGHQRLWALLALAVPTVGWGLAMLHLSGGLGAYLSAVLRQASDTAVTTGLGSGMRILSNWARLSLYALYTLTLGVAVVPLLLPAVARAPRCHLAQPHWQVLGLWLAPSIAFYSLFVQQAGYAFTFMMALIVIVAFGLRRASGGAARRMRRRNLVHYALGVVLACNVTFFVAAPPFLFGARRQLFSAPSLPAIRHRDASVQERITFIRHRFDPQTTIILASTFDLRLPDYYLRDYQRLRVMAEDSADPTAVPLADAISAVILFDEDLSAAPTGPSPHAETLPGGVTLRWFERDADQTLVCTGTTVGLEPMGGNP
jgi:hypothetical protein